MQQQISFLDSLCGKTSPEPSAATREQTFRPSSRPSAPSATIPIMLLDLRTGYGNLLGAYWEKSIASLGKYTTLSTGACPSVVRESTLSQILQLNAPEKYSLSPTACAGIIRRAEKRGKKLPDMLRDALMEVIGLAGGLENIDDDPEYESDAVLIPDGETEDDEDF